MIVTFQVSEVITDLHIGKDVGRIGRYISSVLGMNSEVRGIHKNSKSFLSHDQKWIGFKSALLMYTHLIKNASRIKILHTYHIYRYSFITVILYKILNPKGIVYIKMDSAYINGQSRNFESILKIHRWMLSLFIRSIDYISFEDERYITMFKKLFPKNTNQFLGVTNGFEPFIGDIALKKEKIIVLSGRLGSPEKNYEMVLNLLSDDEIIKNTKDWRIVFLGPYTDDFLDKYNGIISNNKKLKNRVSLQGYIKDKNEMFNIMSKAKIFLHPSTTEGDPIVQYESMYAGCYMICADVGNIKQNYPQDSIAIFENNNINDLKKILIEAINKVGDLHEIFFMNIHNYAKARYSRDNVLKPLKSIRYES